MKILNRKYFISERNRMTLIRLPLECGEDNTRRQNATKFLNQKRDLILPKDFVVLNPNPGSEFTLYVRLMRYSNLKMRKIVFFAIFEMI